MRRAGLLAACLVALVVAVAVYARSRSDERTATAARATATFGAFPLYWVGKGFGGLPLTSFFRFRQPSSMGQLAAGQHNGTNVAGVAYGSCDAEPDSGCAPPLEIQVATACTRNYSLFAANPPGTGPPIVHTRVRGVPAIWVAGHLELYTGTVTIEIDGARALVLRAAAALRPANARARRIGRTDGRLPPPAPGHLEGTVPCP